MSPPLRRTHSERVTRICCLWNDVRGGWFLIELFVKGCYFPQRRDTLPRGGSVLLLRFLSALFWPWQNRHSEKRENMDFFLFFFLPAWKQCHGDLFFFLGTSPTAVYTALIKMWCLQPSFWARTDVALQWKTLPRRSEISVTYGN